MKGIIYLLLFLISVSGFSQSPLLKNFPFENIWKYVGEPGLSTSPGDDLSFAINPATDEPYVAFTPHILSGNGNIRVMRYNGTQWDTVGDTGFTGISSSIAFNATGQPYLFFDGLDDGKAITFDGNHWTDLGFVDFPNLGDIQFPQLAISNNGDLYVAFKDWSFPYTGELSVAKYNGVTWTFLGGEAFIGNSVNWLNIKVSPSGEPYVSYSDVETDYKVSVIKYNGSEWQYVGDSVISEGEAWCTSLAFDPSGVPFVAYMDGVNRNKATVKKYTGSVWVDVGEAGFTPGEAAYTSIAFSTGGELKLDFTDGEKSDKSSVMKFNGSAWEFVGEQGLSSGKSLYSQIAFNSQGRQYIAYTDKSIGNGGVCVMKYDSLFVGIEDKLKIDFPVYPNPTTNSINIENSEKGRLAVLDLSGHQVLTKEITEPKTIVDIGGLQAGVYIIKFTSEKGVQFGKFIKN